MNTVKLLIAMGLLLCSGALATSLKGISGRVLVMPALLKVVHTCTSTCDACIAKKLFTLVHLHVMHSS